MINKNTLKYKDLPIFCVETKPVSRHIYILHLDGFGFRFLFKIK